MMGEPLGRRERLFYEFCLEDRVPADGNAMWHLATPSAGAGHRSGSGHTRMDAIVLPNVQNQY